MNNRAKWAYLPYDSIQQKIDEGVLDSYDVIYTSDTHENLIITPDLQLWSVRSKVYVFSSVDDANTRLNLNTDTYVGQIISIITGDKCKGYIVNKDTNGNYFVDALTVDDIDYNTLGNRPIENLVGTLDTPIFVDTLSSGTYKIKGQYYISNRDTTTTYLSVDGDLFLIEITDEGKCIKRFTKDKIYDYVITDTDIIKKFYITDEYLDNNGYTTTIYVDEKIAAFETSIRADIEAYVEQTVEYVITQKVDEIIDDRLDVKLDERIQETSDEEVQNLFN